jgi:hypothetical protein
MPPTCRYGTATVAGSCAATHTAASASRPSAPVRRGRRMERKRAQFSQLKLLSAQACPSGRGGLRRELFGRNSTCSKSPCFCEDGQVRHGWPPSVTGRKFQGPEELKGEAFEINSPSPRQAQSNCLRKEFARFFNSAVVRQHSGGRTTRTCVQHGARICWPARRSSSSTPGKVTAPA